ncbi:hypothetical protein Cgig2_011983 [Carnegiea gigantea]|uniref:Uncharacterized protein n=1 Tax=Carnegiea gigantea TaxID=171969 RepID=A0A9Q1JHB9_9CARY|nr:hypothetical protein Cgig2_011983 [Carnegiea gigantea]
MTAVPKPHNARKYREFHEQNRHATDECRELTKALHELAHKRKIDHFFQRGPQSLHKDHDLEREEPQEEECSTEMVAPITGGQAEGITGAQQVLMAELGNRITIPVMTFDWCECPHFSSPHNDPLVVEIKVANVLVRRILIDTESSVDIIIRTT